MAGDDSQAAKVGMASIPTNHQSIRASSGLSRFQTKRRCAESIEKQQDCGATWNPLRGCDRKAVDTATPNGLQIGSQDPDIAYEGLTTRRERRATPMETNEIMLEVTNAHAERSPSLGSNRAASSLIP